MAFTWSRQSDAWPDFAVLRSMRIDNLLQRGGRSLHNRFWFLQSLLDHVKHRLDVGGVLVDGGFRVVHRVIVHVEQVERLIMTAHHAVVDEEIVTEFIHLADLSSGLVTIRCGGRTLEVPSEDLIEFFQEMLRTGHLTIQPNVHDDALQMLFAKANVVAR